jgi:hypothetical protein
MRRSTLISIAVFLALLVAVMLRVGRQTERGISRISFAEVAIDTTDRLEISGSNAVELTKDGEIWRLANGREADRNAVRQLLEAIPTIASSDLVTREPNRFSDYQVDAEGGTGVQVFSGERWLAAFVVGKSAPGGAYLLVDGGVYRAPRLPTGLFSRPSSAWLERRLFKDPIEEVAKVEVKLGEGNAYALVNQDGKWELEDSSVAPEGFRFDAKEAQRLATALLNTRAMEFLAEDPGVETTQLDENADLLAYTLKAEEGIGERRELRLGAKTEGAEVYAQVSGSNDIITLAEGTARGLRKPVSDLRDLSMIRVDKEKVVELQIVDRENRLVLQKKDTGWEIATSSQKVPDDFEPDQSQVAHRLARFAGMQAVSLADSKAPKKTGLGRPSAEITATLEDGSVVTLAFGKETEEEGRKFVYARGNADEEIYWVTRFSRETLTGGLDTLKETGPAPVPGGIDPDAFSKLPPDVRKALMKQLRQRAGE